MTIATRAEERIPLPPVQERAELRVEEALLITDYRPLFEQWRHADRIGDAHIEATLRRLYRSLTTDEQRDLCQQVADAWNADERTEEHIVGLEKAHNSRHLREHNDNTPSFTGEAPRYRHDGCGPTGRAA